MRSVGEEGILQAAALAPAHTASLTPLPLTSPSPPVSEAVCEAPTFMEWCTMVVPTYPEGGSHALQVCQHHHQVVRVGDCVRLSEIGGTRCSRLLRSIRG